jgi:hypothetical protein
VSLLDARHVEELADEPAHPASLPGGGLEPVREQPRVQPERSRALPI